MVALAMSHGENVDWEKVACLTLKGLWRWKNSLPSWGNIRQTLSP
jgi:hypothetical protein